MRNIRADEGDFFDRINQINTIFEEDILEKFILSLFMSFMFLLSKISFPNHVNLVNPVQNTLLSFFP